MRRRTTIRRALIVGSLMGFALLARSPTAAAHAALERSEPAGGALLEEAPGQVVLTFTEPPDVALSTVHVLDATGREVEDGGVEPVPEQRFQLSVPLGSLPDGVYTVAWRVVSKTDGHLTAASFAFGVGVSPEGAVPPPGIADLQETPPPSPLSVAGRLTLYAGLAVLVAGGVVGLYVFGGRLPARRSVLLSAWTLAGAGVVAILLAERSAVGVPLSTLLSSDTGGPLVGLAVAVGVTGALTVVAAFVKGRTTLVIVAAAAGVAMLLRASAGHAGTAGSLTWINLRLQWVHMLAAGIWVGGLLWLLLSIRRSEAGERAAEIKRFSTLAGLALAAVVLTGVLRSVDELGGWGAWLHVTETGYGITLAIKVAVFLGLVSLGAWNRYVNVAGISSGSRGLTPLRRGVAAEIVLAVGVFGLTGALTGMPPPGGAPRALAAPRPERLVVTGSDFATSVNVRLEISPGTVGPNRFEARVTDYDTKEPVPADRVVLRFSMPERPEVGASTLELEAGSPGLWTGQGTQLSIDGHWSAVVLIQHSEGSTEVPLHVELRAPPPTAEVQRVSGQPDLYTITFAGGTSIQAYVDPGAPGKNDLHITAFDEGGQELPLESVAVEAGPDSGNAAGLSPTRFSPGHFVAEVHITPGPWTFAVDARTNDGATLRATFNQTFG